ncbi:MAG: dynamin family protein [Chloroflexi bacterium]|nr:dynamin family protein [Chloroflexota bacterium]
MIVTTDRFAGLEEFDRLRESVAKRMEGLAGRLDAELGSSENSAELRRQATWLREGVFRVLVMGDFNRGKSTVLNALLGSNILPINATPTTAVITVIRFGPEPKVYVKFSNGRPDEELTFEQFKGEYQLSLDDDRDSATNRVAKLDRFSEVDRAIVEYNLELCRYDVELVDSPGLNDHPARTQRVIEQLKRTDAVVFVFDAMHFYTQQEQEYLDNLVRRHNLTNLFFLVNAWDNIERSSLNPEEDEAKIRLRMKKELSKYVADGHFEERVFEVSALQALTARWDKKTRQPRPIPDEIKLANSHMAEFECELDSFLRNERGRVLIDRSLRSVELGLARAREEIAARLSTLGVEVSELERRLRATEPGFARLNQIRDNLLRAVEGVSKTQQKSIYESLHSFFRRMEGEFTEDARRFMDESEGGVLNLASLPEALFDSERFRAKLAVRFEDEAARYFNRRLTEWNVEAQAQLREVFEKLKDELLGYAAEYDETVEAIRRDFLGGAATGPWQMDASSVSDTLERWLSGSSFFDFDPQGMASGSSDVFGDVVRVLAVYGLTYAVIGGVAGLIGLVLSTSLLGLPALLVTVVVGGSLGSKVLTSRLVDAYSEHTRKQLMPSVEAKESDLKAAVGEIFNHFGEELGRGVQREIDDLRGSFQKAVARKRELEGKAEQERIRLEGLRGEGEARLSEIRAEVDAFFK